MNFAELSLTADQVTALFSLVLAVGATIALVYKASAFIADSYITWRRRRTIRGLLIKPTAEELAKYALGVQSSTSPDERAYQKLMRQRRSVEQAVKADILERRILLLGVLFFICFSGLGGVYTWNALFRERVFDPIRILHILERADVF